MTRSRPEPPRNDAPVVLPLGRWGRRILLVGVVGTVVLLWGSSLPLGIPGEWTWARIPAESGAEVALGVVQAVIAVGIYLAAVLIGGRHIASASRRGLVVRFTALFAAAFAMHSLLQESPPGLYRLQKAPLVLFAPSTSGYFFHARFKAGDTVEFLRGYEAWAAKGDVLHLGTHPPGLFVFHRALVGLCEAFPALGSLVLTTQPESVRETFALIDEFPMGAPAQLTPADQASLWLAALLTQASCLLTVVPLFLLIHRYTCREAAWFTASLWPLVPAAVIFQPKSDVLYALPSVLLLWSWIEALDRRSVMMGSLTGLLAFGGLFTTLAFLPTLLVLAFLGLSPVRQVFRSPPERRSVAGALRPWIGAAIGFTGPVLAFQVAVPLNLPAVWWHNFQNHAGFYGQYPRTIWLWRLVNPLELALAVGWPVAVLAVACVRAAWRDASRMEARRLAACLVAVALLLWLSGKNSGEAARLWIFLMPWLLILIGLGSEPNSLRPPTSVPPFFALVLQSIVLIATALRVTGFTYPTL